MSTRGANKREKKQRKLLESQKMDGKSFPSLLIAIIQFSRAECRDSRGSGLAILIYICETILTCAYTHINGKFRLLFLALFLSFFNQQ